MIRRIAMTAAFALALGGCATDSAHRDGSYGGNYDGGYYSAPSDGYGDYYYDRPEVVIDYGAGYFGGPYVGYGFGFGPPWAFGFGYNPWFYRPWWGDGDGDADDWHHRWHKPGPHHHADPVDLSRHNVQVQTSMAPRQQPDRLPPPNGRQGTGQRDGGRHQQPTRPPRQ